MKVSHYRGAFLWTMVEIVVTCCDWKANIGVA